MFNKVKKIISIIILMILLPILFVSGVILVNSFMYPEEIPSFFGWKPFIVLSGSMESEIYAGDVAVVKEAESFKKGDIIAFKTDEDLVITHRIVEIIEKDGRIRYITKGDNNNIKDNGYVLPEQIEGIYQFKISRVGNLAMFIQTPTGMIISLSIPLIILVLVQVSESRKDKEYMEAKGQKEKEMQEEIERLRRQNEDLMKENNN